MCQTMIYDEAEWPLNTPSRRMARAIGTSYIHRAAGDVAGSRGCHGRRRCHVYCGPVKKPMEDPAGRLQENLKEPCDVGRRKAATPSSARIINLIPYLTNSSRTNLKNLLLLLIINF